MAGFEPVHPFEYQFGKLAWLPITPHRHISLSIPVPMKEINCDMIFNANLSAIV